MTIDGLRGQVLPLPLWKLLIWEVAALENTLGKLPLGKYLTSLCTQNNCRVSCSFDNLKFNLNIRLITRGFNGSVNISENCDFRSQFEPFYIIL